MNHRNSTELFLRMARQYQADMAVAAAYIKEKDIHFFEGGTNRSA